MRNVETVEYLTTNEPTKTTHFIVNHSEQFSDTFQPGNPHYEALSTTMENEKKPLLAGAPSGGKFAIFELGGTQHKVAVNDVIINDKIQPVEVFKVGAEIVSFVFFGFGFFEGGIPLREGCYWKVSIFWDYHINRSCL